MPTLRVAKTFEAVLERTGNRLNWTVVRIPLDVQRLWGVRGHLRVRGDINGFPFRSSLFPDGKGGHFMMVNKKVQAGAHVSPGQSVRLRMEPDLAKRVVKIPAELTRAMRDSKRLVKYYASLGDFTRREIARWVADAKQPETRKRRADQIAERLMQTMDAENGDLPPQLELAFRQNPNARLGWMKMPPGHKRQHLFGIFHYQNPESRARRIAKAIEDMIAYAEKQQKRHG